MNGTRHEWSQATEPKVPGSRTEIVEVRSPSAWNTSSSLENTFVLVTEEECLALVSSLRAFTVEEIGSAEFLHVYGYNVERLSLQAHLHATTPNTNGIALGISSQEYVLDAIAEGGKTTALVRTLLAVEAWRIFVLPELAKTEDDSSSRWDRRHHLRVAFSLHVETTLVGLLGLLTYSKGRFDEVTTTTKTATHSCHDDGDVALTLVDYCARCMARLVNATDRVVFRQKAPPSSTSTSTSTPTNDPSRDLEDLRLDAEYKTFVGASTVLARQLCEHADHLSVQTRILDVHDYLQALVALIEEPPWTRRRQKSNGNSDPSAGAGPVVWEKYVENEWRSVPPDELLRLTSPEAQCWMAVHHLLCGGAGGDRGGTYRELYALDDQRKSNLLRLRRYLHEVLLDQLPVLADVMRYLDELSLMEVPPHRGATVTSTTNAWMQQVDVLRESVLRQSSSSSKGKRINGAEVARTQREHVFSSGGGDDHADRALREISSIYDVEGIEDILAPAPAASTPYDDHLRSVPSKTSTTTPTTERVVQEQKKKDMERSAGKSGTDPKPTATVLITSVGTQTTTTLHLRCTDEKPAQVETPSNGVFQRFKMTVHNEKSSISPAVIHPHSTVVIQLKPMEKTLTCHDVDLPNQTLNSNGDDQKQVIWRQLGSIHESVALQLAFKREARQPSEAAPSWTLTTAFLSCPMPVR